MFALKHSKTNFLNSFSPKLHNSEKLIQFLLLPRLLQANENIFPKPNQQPYSNFCHKHRPNMDLVGNKKLENGQMGLENGKIGLENGKISLENSLGCRMYGTNGFQMSDTQAEAEKSFYKKGELLQKVVDVTLKESLNMGATDEEFRAQKVLDFKHPEELIKLLDLDFGREGCENVDEFESIVEKVVKFSVKTGHPNFYNQLYGGVDEVGLASGWLTESLNTNQHTFEVAPAFVMMEYNLIKQLSAMIGWSGGDGVFGPGGSALNLYGISLAKHNKYPELKESGLFGKKELVLFTSDMSHYSVDKAAFWMGFGTKQVVHVESDQFGCMEPQALREAIGKVRKEGREPFFVNATAGTTVLGAYDDFDVIGDICKEEGVWMHIDACWGGGVLFSKKHKALLKGMEKADSFAWNAHKMLSIPLQCSLFLTKHTQLLTESHRLGATYLFMPDKFYDVSFDTGDKSIQCGRKADALKLWMYLKTHGSDKIAARVDQSFAAAEYLESEIGRREGFRKVVSKRMCTNVCFWYVPPSMRGKTEDEAWWEQLHKVSPKIKERMVKKGDLMAGYVPMKSKNLVNFFRVIVTPFPVPKEQYMDFILDEIESLGKDL